MKKSVDKWFQVQMIISSRVKVSKGSEDYLTRQGALQYSRRNLIFIRLKWEGIYLFK